MEKYYRILKKRLIYARIKEQKQNRKDEKMRILIIRHGDPDYSIDGLTEKGKREVKLLAEKMSKEKISAIYCSPLGRARLTAQPTAEALGMDVKVLDWLREFDYARVNLPYLEAPACPWDLLPEFVAHQSNIYSPDLWSGCDFIKNSSVTEAYSNVTSQLDALLKAHGYEREGCNYKAISPNHDTVVLVCHFGLTGVLLSHLLNCSPYSIWQHVVCAPTSVTTLYTEERREGVASFRAQSIGDLSHLYAGTEEPAFAARFCECWTDDTRHD